MKLFIASVVLCLFSICAFAQLNTDTTQNVIRYKTPVYDTKVSKAYDHLHPKYSNIANPDRRSL